jgi:hypothetical protein
MLVAELDNTLAEQVRRTAAELRRRRSVEEAFSLGQTRRQAAQAQFALVVP